jgi:type I restriction enzyme, S subunit
MVSGLALPHARLQDLTLSLRGWPISLPPLEEQREIVRRADQLLALADGPRQRIDLASTRVDRSSQTVLANAFRPNLIRS